MLSLKKLNRLRQTAGATTIIYLLGIENEKCEDELIGKTYIQKGVVCTYTPKSIAYKLYALFKIRAEGPWVIYKILFDVLASKWLTDDVRYQAKLYLMWLNNHR